MEAHILALPNVTPDQITRARQQVTSWLFGFLEEEKMVSGPSDLGFPGYGSWADRACADILGTAAYEYAVMGRMEGLKTAAAANRPVIPLVQENIRDFVRDRIIRTHLLAPGKPTEQQVLVVVAILGDWLKRELRRRGLVSQSPSLLGFSGYTSWNDGDCSLCAAIGSYAFSIHERREPLRVVASTGRPVAPLVRRNIGFFIHNQQKANDLLGYRVYQAAKSAIKQLSDQKFLDSAGGDRLRVIRFIPLEPPAPLANQPDLKRHIVSHPEWPAARWNFMGRPKESAQWVGCLLKDMPKAEIRGFMLDDFLGTLRDGLAEWLAPRASGKKMETFTGPVPGDGPNTESPRFWDIFDKDTAIRQLEKAPTKKSRDILCRMLKYLENQSWEESLVKANMAQALGMTRQALNFHWPRLEKVLESSRK